MSLYEEWKAVAALVFAGSDDWRKGPAELYTLVGGDFPGIQEFVFTITSKGAAKSLRGRSFFLQLLCDGVIRRLLEDLNLASVNIVYAAGGNFFLLAPALIHSSGGQTTQEILAALDESFQRALLDRLQGDLTLSLSWTAFEQTPQGMLDYVSASASLKRKIDEKKRRRFHEISKDRWGSLFGPQGKPGNERCAICHRPLEQGEGHLLAEDEEEITPESPRRCDPCQGFQELAEAIARAVWMDIHLDIPKGGERKEWQNTIWQVCHIWYELSPDFKPAPNSKIFHYCLNDPDFVYSGCHGFRLIANTTPIAGASDLTRWQEDPFREEQEKPRPGNIRSFSQLASAAAGVERVGILRMDVDNLGQIFVRGLQPSNLASVSGLSATLETFFAGWLNQICTEVNQPGGVPDERGDRLYVIYAGGDDLFCVGAWDAILELAQRIHDDFQAYCGYNPYLHISAGATLENKKFPLYQAARAAGEAEDLAKGHRLDGIPKDSISFLGLAFKWNEWKKVTEYRDLILELIKKDEQGEKAPASKALVHVLQDIYTQHHESVLATHRRLTLAGQEIPDEPHTQVYYGPWMWRLAYSLTRMTGHDRVSTAKLLDLQKACIEENKILQVGLAARWAELLIRKEE